MSDEQDKLKLSLEPPKLFGRKKKDAARPSATDRVEPAAQRPSSARRSPAPQPAETPDTEPVAEPVVETPTRETSAPEPTVVLDAVEEAPAPTPAVVEPEPEPVAVEPEPAVEAEPAAVAAEPTVATAEPVAEPAARFSPEQASRAAAPAAETATAPQQAEPVVVPAAAARSQERTPTPAARPAPRVVHEPVDDFALEDAQIAEIVARDAILTTYRAAALTGLVVGAAMVALTFLSLRGCEAVRGTSSCGGGPGFLLLVATFAVSVLLGSALLKMFSIPDPGSSSFLAVGMVAVVALLFLIDLLDSWTMLVIIPVLSIGAYMASAWVTETFVEPD